MMKQCWSQKARNRPSFNAVLQHLGILKNELQTMSNEVSEEREGERERERERER